MKGFGAVGSSSNGASGLKVVHAYAVSASGVPMGVLNQQWWARPRRKKRSDCQSRPLQDKETLHWVKAIDEAASALAAVGSKAWFQIDREGDRLWTLKALRDSGEWSPCARPMRIASSLRAVVVKFSFVQSSAADPPASRGTNRD